MKTNKRMLIMSNSRHNLINNNSVNIRLINRLLFARLDRNHNLLKIASKYTYNHRRILHRLHLTTCTRKYSMVTNVLDFNNVIKQQRHRTIRRVIVFVKPLFNSSFAKFNAISRLVNRDAHVTRAKKGQNYIDVLCQLGRTRSLRVSNLIKISRHVGLIRVITRMHPVTIVTFSVLITNQRRLRHTISGIKVIGLLNVNFRVITKVRLIRRVIMFANKFRT